MLATLPTVSLNQHLIYREDFNTEFAKRILGIYAVVFRQILLMAISIWC